MPGKLHRLTYVHAGDPGPIGAAIEAGGRLLHFGTEGSGLFGLSVDEKGQPSIANARALAVRIDVKGLDELPAYLKSVPFFDQVNRSMLGFSDEDFASWLLGELLRSGSIEVKDGWILPTMAP